MAKDERWWPADDAVKPYMIRLMKFDEFHAHSLVRIDFHFSAEAPVRDGMEVAGLCVKINRKTAYLAMPREDQESHGPDAEPMKRVVVRPRFIIYLSWVHWNQATLGVEAEDLDHFREALLHHELMHIDPLDEKTLPHTTEAFPATIHRYGAWNPSLVATVGAFAMHLEEAK